MVKKRGELNLDGRSAFYTMLFNKMKEKAADLGYALTVHGSMMSDMDMIAVPWVEDVAEPIELVTEISKFLEPTIWKDHHFKENEDKPHNRVVYTMSIYSDWYIDLSIIKPIPKK